MTSNIECEAPIGTNEQTMMIVVVVVIITKKNFSLGNSIHSRSIATCMGALGANVHHVEQGDSGSKSCEDKRHGGPNTPPPAIVTNGTRMNAVPKRGFWNNHICYLSAEILIQIFISWKLNCQ